MPEMKSLPSGPWAFIWNLLKNHKWKIYGIILVMFTVSLLIVVNPYLLKLFIDKIINNNFPQDLLNDRKNIFIAVLLVFLNVFGNLLWRIANYLSLKIFPIVRSKAYTETFSYLSFHSHQYFQDNLSGDLAHKVQDIAESTENIFEPLFSIIYIVFTVLIAIVMMYTINSYFAYTLIVWVIFFITISLVLSNKISNYAKVLAQIRSVLSGRCVDSIMNIFNVNVFARQDFEKHYINSISKDVISKDTTLRWKLIELWTIQSLLSSIILCVMIFLLLHLYSKSVVTAGDFVFIISIVITIIQQIFGTAELISNILQRIGIFKQAVSLIYSPHTIVDIGNTALKVRKGEIIFNNIEFYHRERDRLFDNLNITIKANQKIGLVGRSGSGKSTFVNLLIRLYDLHSGSILIDGQNIKDITIRSIKENISIVPQNPMIFNRSIFENIRYGKLNATKKEVIEAAKKAHAHEFILETSNGYNSVLGEGGIKLSGGQRQRIAIARAILKNAPILILDEATSSLDSVTELLLQDSLKEFMHNKTVIVISHRLLTLLAMDRILVFKQGQIVEDGSHNDLIAKQNLYFTLWNSQKKGFLGESNAL